MIRLSLDYDCWGAKAPDNMTWHVSGWWVQREQCARWWTPLDEHAIFWSGPNLILLSVTRDGGLDRPIFMAIMMQMPMSAQALIKWLRSFNYHHPTAKHQGMFWQNPASFKFHQFIDAKFYKSITKSSTNLGHLFIWSYFHAKSLQRNPYNRGNLKLLTIAICVDEYCSGFCWYYR